MGTWLVIVILIVVVCLSITIGLLILQIKHFTSNPSRYLTIPRFVATFSYFLFHIAQILNYLSIFTNYCEIWYILSMIFLWCARLSICTEILSRCRLVSEGNHHFDGFYKKTKYLICIAIITYITCIVLILIFNASKVSNNICVPQYVSIPWSIALIHTFDILLLFGGEILLIKLFNFHKNRPMKIEHYSAQITYIQYKCAIQAVFLIFSGFLLFINSLYLYNTYFLLYGIIISFDGTINIFINLIIQLRYKKIFNKLFGCIVKSVENNDRYLQRRRINNEVSLRLVTSKRLDEIASIIHIKYKLEYEPVILDTLKQCKNPYLLDEIINIIISYIEPARTMKNIWRPYWFPSVTYEYGENITSDTISKSLTKSKYGGVPYLSMNEVWPRCLCGNRLYLYLQINMNQLPDEYKNKYLSIKQIDMYSNCLLQYFQCIQLECNQNIINKSSNYLVRFIKINTIENEEEEKMDYEVLLNELKSFQLSSNEDSQWLEVVINGWNLAETRSTTTYELPSIHQYIVLYLGIFDDIKQFEHDIGHNPVDLINKRNHKDKLCGYYHASIENDKIPICSICNNIMENMIFQTDGSFTSCKFIDNTIAGIYVCNNHPLQLQIVCK